MTSGEQTPPVDPVSQLLRASTGGYPDGLDLQGLGQLEQGVPYLEGTTARLPAPQFVVTGEGLAIPTEAISTPMDYMAVYVTLNEYLGDAAPFEPGGRSNADLFSDHLIASVEKHELVLQLCMLTAIAGKATATDSLLKQYLPLLKEEARTRLITWLDAKRSHQFLARQPILAALLRTVARTPSSPAPFKLPPLLIATMLTHTVGVDLNWGDAMGDEGEKFGGFPENVAVDLISNQTFYDSDDIVSVIDRNHRLWRDYEAVTSELLDGFAPNDLLRAACGLDVEDFFAYGFALIALPMAWEPGKPFGIYDDFGGDTNTVKKRKFIGIVSRTVEELTQRMAEEPQQADWDFFALKETPVVLFPDTAPPLSTVVPTDIPLLLEKITTGLYWIVHDDQKASRGELARQRWTQAWGAAVEAMIEDDLRPLAPTLLGEGGQTFFTEEDLRKAYPGIPNADVVIDYGSHFAVVEIVSGRLHSETIKGRSPVQLRSDMEKIVYKKVRQLNNSVEALRADPSPLLGADAPQRRIQPILVAGGGFPLSPITSAAISEYCEENSMFIQAGILPFALLTVDEVEMLEGLAENAMADPCDLIARWKQSSLANMSFRNWLLERYGRSMLIYRPSRMKPRFDSMTQTIVERLDLRPV